MAELLYKLDRHDLLDRGARAGVMDDRGRTLIDVVRSRGGDDAAHAGELVTLLERAPAARE